MCADASTEGPTANGQQLQTTITLATTVLRVIDPLQPPPNPVLTRWIDRG
jgi:hypothetical protein